MNSIAAFHRSAASSTPTKSTATRIDSATTSKKSVFSRATDDNKNLPSSRDNRARHLSYISASRTDVKMRKVARHLPRLPSSGLARAVPAHTLAAAPGGSSHRTRSTSATWQTVSSSLITSSEQRMARSRQTKVVKIRISIQFQNCQS